MNNATLTRRQAAARFASWVAASPLVRAQQPLIGEPAGRIAPTGDLVNTLEFAAMAERKLSAETFALVADHGRRGFERITLRPRMMVNTAQLDLTTELFGQKLFAPIIVGPVAGQARFHADAEHAMAQGAAGQQTVMTVSARPSVPMEQIAAQAKGTLWCQVYPESDVVAWRARIAKAAECGCKAVCITVGGPDAAGADWKSLASLRQAARVPVIIKGIMTPEEAREAVSQGFAGIVVSKPAGTPADGFASPIEVLPSIAEAVGGKIPILVDGGFRRGTDVLIALALGARAVMLARPPTWALAAYGAGGVQALLRLLIAELARNMAMCGKTTVAGIGRDLVTIHRR